MSGSAGSGRARHALKTVADDESAGGRGCFF
jgi:hypothetical protein